MKMLLYASEGDPRQRLEESCQRFAKETRFDVFRDIDSLTLRLRKPIHEYAFAIIMAVSQDEFDRILKISTLLIDLNVIIVLPDRNPETISAALQLHPRYMGFADSDLSDVSFVAERMLQQMASKQWAGTNRKEPA